MLILIQEKTSQKLRALPSLRTDNWRSVHMLKRRSEHPPTMFNSVQPAMRKHSKFASQSKNRQHMWQLSQPYVFVCRKDGSCKYATDCMTARPIPELQSYGSCSLLHTYRQQSVIAVWSVCYYTICMNFLDFSSRNRRSWNRWELEGSLKTAQKLSRNMLLRNGMELHLTQYWVAAYINIRMILSVQST